jgi:hypothetical protein
VGGLENTVTLWYVLWANEHGDEMVGLNGSMDGQV